MKTLSGKHVLITGAGSGIGKATARVCAKAQAILHLVDINEGAVEQTGQMLREEGGSCYVYTADVADRCSMQQLADQVHQNIDGLDVLVNNAGIGSAGRFLETSLDTWDKVYSVNVKGVVHGCHFFLPAMIAHGRGAHVVNLASMAAYAASPEMPIYASSKFAVLGFSEALRIDMQPHGIGVSAICPGVIDTAIVANTHYEGQMSDAKDKVIDFYRKRAYSPDKVAQAIVKAIRKNIGVMPVSPESWALYYAKRLVPGMTEQVLGIKLPFTKGARD